MRNRQHKTNEKEKISNEIPAIHVNQIDVFFNHINQHQDQSIKLLKLRLKKHSKIFTLTAPNQIIIKNRHARHGKKTNAKC